MAIHNCSRYPRYPLHFYTFKNERKAYVFKLVGIDEILGCVWVLN